MQRPGITPSELRPAEILRLPDGRVRVTRWRKITQGREAATDMFPDYGAVDPAAKTGVAGGTEADVRLIDQRVDYFENKPALVQVYEEIPATAEIQVGQNTRIKLEDGREAIEANFLQFTAGTYAPGTVGTTTAPGDSNAYLKTAEAPDDGCLRRIKRNYVYAGIVSTDLQIKEGGKLLIQTIVSVKTVPSTPSGYTLIGEPTQNPNGLPVYSYTYAKGAGLVLQEIASRTDGLREVTNIALGTRVAPTGAVTRDTYKEDDGYITYTVSAMQSAAGGAPTDASLTLPVDAPWTWPGRAKAYSRTAENGQKVIDVFRSPPVSSDIAATMTVTYQTSASLGSVGTRWQPREWATIEAEWIGLSNHPGFEVQALPGYRSVDVTPISLTVDIWEATTDGGTMLGNTIFGGTTALLTVFGGPANPDGNTYTLKAGLEVAFADVDGTEYYRKTVISATIPAQADLPI